MLNRITETALKYPGIVLIAIVGVILGGIHQYRVMPVDAFPDISPVMVPVFAEGHGMAPEEMERLVTYPIESAMNGLPGVQQIKSTSAFGMSVVYVYFEDDVDIYFARRLVSERLGGVIGQLPHMDEPPALGPISTGLGQVFIYYLSADPERVDTGGKELDVWLRELNDWVVKFQLKTVPGVTDVLSMGGHVLQYQIHLNPNQLRQYGLTLDAVVDAVRDNNRNVGGQFLVLGAEEHLVRGLGLIEGLDDIRDIPIKVVRGVPVRIGDVARVEFGREIRRGVVTHNGETEVVSGIVMQLYGANTSEVIARLHEQVERVRALLPEGVALVPYYDQSELVAQATGTVKKALMQGGVLVILVLALFLGNWRSALIVGLSLPVCVFIALLLMGANGVSANLMSLGGIAIAIGMLGDGAIVMVENIFRHLSGGQAEPGAKREVIAAAAREVSRPIAFSIGIIVMVFLPLFSMEGVEGKMFTPLALTLVFGLLGSLAVALFMAPALSFFLMRPVASAENAFIRRLRAGYRPLLRAACRRPRIVLGASVVVLVASLLSLRFIGREFMPVLEEGSILIGVTMAPSISLEHATETVMSMERAILQIPAVEETVSRIGRPEAGSHPHPVNYAEIQLALKPRGERSGLKDKAELIGRIRHELEDIPGVQLNFSQPIQNAFDELISGIKSQLAIKVYGDDLPELESTATAIYEAIEDVPGLVDASVEQSIGQPQIQVVVDRAQSARYGLNVTDVLEMVELAVGGEVIDQVYLNTRRFGIHLRYDEPFRMDPEAIRGLLIATVDQAGIPLGQVAEVRQVTGPIQISRERNQRRWVVQGNVSGRDLNGVVEDIRDRIEERVELPAGVSLEFGGQFENQQRAMRRLSIIVPIVIGGVFLLLWMAFGSLRDAMTIVVNVPLALVGGVLGLWIMGEYLSVPASVGFIALFGIAVQNGLVLVSYFNDLRAAGYGLHEAVEEGALLRLRPVLMTALTTILGLLPLLLAHGIGAEVQRPLAAVVVFGLATSTLLTLFVIPAGYLCSGLAAGSLRPAVGGAVAKG
ncbi:MAG: CusA/CzcA family heavy metal efflux RND transporter [Verrucomicrobiota bacterium]|nr:CusA/CzcA family heavy metal efflux RND transporter [Verrucomicrobiota bacterium]